MRCAAKAWNVFAGQALQTRAASRVSADIRSPVLHVGWLVQLVTRWELEV